MGFFKLKKKKPTHFVAAWLGKFPNESSLIHEYMAFDYEEDQDNPKCQFAEDTGIDWFDNDWTESWWFEEINLTLIEERLPVLLDQEAFRKELLAELGNLNLNGFNSITFLFGEAKESGFNNFLADYKGSSKLGSQLKFIKVFPYTRVKN